MKHNLFPNLICILMVMINPILTIPTMAAPLARPADAPMDLYTLPAWFVLPPAGVTAANTHTKPDLAAADLPPSTLSVLPAWFALADDAAKTLNAAPKHHTILQENVTVSGPAEINNCDAVTFTIAATNDAMTTTNVAIVSAMPTGFTPPQRVCSFASVAPNQTVTCTAVFAAGCDAVSGQNETTISQDGYPDYTILTEYLVNPGAITVRKEPAVIQAGLGDLVTWTVYVENTGYGLVSNVMITDILGSGLTYVSGLTITSIPSIAPGGLYSFPIVARVASCSGLDNVVTATWGCGTETCLTPQTAKGSVDLLVEEPLLDYTPPAINIGYCAGQGTFSMTIYNIGAGTAFTPSLAVDFTPLLVTASSAPYTGGAFNLPAIPGGGSWVLTFTLSLPAVPCGSAGSGSVVYQPLYYDECGNPFYPTIHNGTWVVGTPAPWLDVNKTGPDEIYANELITYNLDVTFGGLTGTVFITDMFQAPCGYTLISAGGGTVITGANGITLTWATNSSPWTRTLVFSPTNTCPDVCGCCGQFIHNRLIASGGDCQDCTLTDTASVGTPVQCEQILNSHGKAISPASDESCTTRTFTNTYIFGSSFVHTPTWQGMVFTDLLPNLTYVAGSLYISLTNGADACTATFDLDSTAPLVISNILPTCAITVPGATMRIIYQAVVQDNFTCSDDSFYDWSYLDLGVTGNYTPCAVCDDGLFEEGVWVDVLEPAMDIAVSGVPEIASDCGVYTPTITLSRTSSVPAYDVRATFPLTSYAIIELLGYGGITPTSYITSSSHWTWYYGDAFATATTATIYLRVQRRCNASGPIEAFVYYDNLCTNDGAYGDACSAHDAQSPRVFGADLILYKFPEIIYASGDVVTWTLSAINSGAGTAYSVVLTDTLGPGLRYVTSRITSTMESAAGVTPITSTHVVRWPNLTFLPGEEYTIQFVAEVLNCSDLTNDLSAALGCLGQVCLSRQTTSRVEIPPAVLINTNLVLPIISCFTGTVTATVRNAGLLSVYSATVTETLPSGLSYIPGTTEYVVDTSATPPSSGWINAGDPSGAPYGPLAWTSAEITALARLLPHQTVWVRFAVKPMCPFEGGLVTINTGYYDVCTQHHTTAGSSYRMNLRTPELEIAKVETSPGPYDCGDVASWSIYVTNTTPYTAQLVRITDTLGSGFALVAATPGYIRNGNVLTWTLANLTSSVHLTLTAQITTPCGSVVNNVRAAWGCGTYTNTECLAGARAATAADDIVRAAPNVVAVMSAEPMTACTNSGLVTVTATNVSTIAIASNIVLTINRPAGGPFVYTIPQLDPGMSATFALTVDLDCATVIALQLNGSYENCCGSRYALTSSLPLPITYPDLSIAISPTPNGLTCGDLATWIITVTNNSTTSAEFVRVGAQLYAAFDFAAATTPYCYDNTNPPSEYIYWEVVDLAPGAFAVFTVTAVYLNPGGINPPGSGCDDSQRRIRVRTVWGCGTADGNPGTGWTFSGAPCNGADVGVECVNPAVVSHNSTSALIPNLIVQDINVNFSACDVVGRGTITVTLQNQSHGPDTGPIPAGTVITVHIVVDGGIFTRTLTHTLPAPLAPGATVVLTATQIQWEQDCGPHTIVVTADPICECNWADNSRSEPFYIDCSGVSAIVASGDCDLAITATGFITGTPPYTYAWHYGDGAASSGVTTSLVITTHHTYTACGDYDVVLVVTSDVGCTLSDTNPAHVNQPPVASIGAIDSDCSLQVSYENTSQDCDEDGDPFLYDPYTETLTFTWRLYNGDGALLWSTTIVNSETDPYPDGLTPPGIITGCGVYTVTIAVTDSHGCTDTATSPFYVNQPPAPPTLILTDSNPCDLSFTYAFTGTDCDGLGALTATLIVTSAGGSPVVITITHGNLITGSGSLSVLGCGTYTAALEIVDDQDCSIRVTDTIYISQPPQITSVNITQTDACADVVTYTAIASDCEGTGALTWRLDFSDGGSVTGTGGSIVGAYTLQDPENCGFITATLTVTDSGYCVVSQTTAPADLNQPPQIIHVTITQTNPCTGVVDYSAVVSDCDGLGGLTWRLDFSDGGFAAGAGSAVAGSYTLLDPFNCGFITATLTVTDDGNCATSQTAAPASLSQPPYIVTVTVTQANACADVVTYTAIVTDCDGLSGLTWRLDFSDGGSVTGAGGPIAGAYTLQNPDNCGFITATLTITDSGYCATSRTTAPADLNQPPQVVTATLNQMAPCVAAITYTAAATDCDNDPFTFAWAFYEDGVLAATSASPSGIYTPTVGFCGLVTATLRVSDGLCTNVTTVTSTVNLDLPPQIQAASLAQPGCSTIITFTSTVYDCDSAMLYYLWSFYQNGALVATSTLPSGVYTPNSNFCGVVTATLIVSDGLCADVTLATPTVDVDLPPQIQMAALGPADPCSAHPITYTASADDCDGDPFNFTWTFYEDGVAMATSRLPSGMYTPSAEFCGAITATVAVSDGLCVNLTVVTPTLELNRPPVIHSAVLSQPNPCGAVITFTSDVFDCDNDFLSYLWSLYQDGQLIYTATTSEGMYTLASDLCGVVTATLVVSDGLCDTLSGATASTELNAAPDAAAVLYNDPSTCVSDDQVLGGYAEDCDGDLLTYVWNLGGPGVITPTVVITAPSGTWYTRTFAVNDCGPLQIDFAAYDPAGCVTTDSVTLNVPCCAVGIDLSKTYNSPGYTVTEGARVTFTIRITNTGAANATQINMADTFDPNHLSLPSAFPPPDSMLTNTLRWNDLTLLFGDLEPGQSIEILAAFTAINGTATTTNTVVISGENACGCTLPSHLTSESSVTVVPPTAVELLYFRVGQIVEREVELEWATAAEIDNFGFKLYRANSNNVDHATFVHFEPATAKGGHLGATYAYVDTVPSNGVWWYWLADVDTSGRETLHTPINVIIGAPPSPPYHIYLPLVLKQAA